MTKPYGSWSSPITSVQITAGSLRLAAPRLDGGDLYWLEGRPLEGGRQVVVRARDGAIEDVTPTAANVRTLVHEYGGGEYTVHAGSVYFSDLRDGRVYRQRNGAPSPVTPAGAGYADLSVSPDGRWLVAVEERARAGGEPENRIVAFPLDGAAEPRVVAAGHDFASFPRFSPDGQRLAFTVWDHPNMPWDGTLLFELAWGEAGPTGPAQEIAGGARESVFQPGFSPSGRLTFASDRSGWWNLYQRREGGDVALCARAAEFGAAQWVFGLSTWGYVSEGVILCVRTEASGTRLARLDVEASRLDDFELPYTSFSGVRVEGDLACFVGASPERAPAVCTLDLSTGAHREVRSSFSAEVDGAFIAVPEAVTFPTADGHTAHAYVYRPTHASASAPMGERPPLLVKSHGGPTSATSDVLDLRIQFWTSRGFAVADVDYRGSTGYGRAYRELLEGAWGVADVEDCVNIVEHLARLSEVDGERAAISGGSAGGYTTLCALTFHDTFRAGASHYGIGDLEALVRDTHKFESRYLDGLIGPYPECKDLYLERSPIHFTDRLTCPVIFFQGLEDRVVPPNQAEAMVAALADRGIPHAYVPFEGEQHGFRRAENIRMALDGELYFYSRIFGFDVGENPGVVVRGGG